MPGVRFDDKVLSGEYEVESEAGGGSGNKSEGYPFSSRESVTEKDVSSSRDNGGSVTMIGANQTKHVRRLRILVLLVLFLAGVAVSLTVYFVTSAAEEEEFRVQFDGVAAKVLESFRQIVGEKIAAASSLAVATTQYAAATNATFPFVTLNGFAQRAEPTLKLADALLLEFMPMVHDQAQKAEWELYATQNRAWFDQATTYFSAVNDVHGAYFEQAGESRAGLPFIYEFAQTEDGWGIVPAQGEGPYTPAWQHLPTLPIATNLNALSYYPYAKAIAAAYATGKISLGGVFRAAPGDMNSPDVSSGFYALLLSLKAGTPVAYEGQPMSFFAHPVFDYARPATPEEEEEEEDQAQEDPQEQKVVSVLGVVVNWASYFDGVVPPQIPPVALVLENACDGAFTFTADNEKVQFQGAGDLHDTTYDNLERKAALDSLYAQATDNFHSLELDQLECPFSLRVYPTRQMEEENESNIPLITTLAVAMVFVFAASVFSAYNHLVERRQNFVLSQATESTALVSSFLPSSLQQRLLGGTDDADEDGAKQGGNNQGGYSSPMSRLKNFLDEGSDTGNVKPIADTFPHTTVLLADIAGFTAWSSTREPAQVFVLLQTVYTAFDVIAKRHKVFKVETIGDCYVAVTGLPNEQPRHAVLMARFAWECLMKFGDLSKQLEIRLGPDTSDLGMRFGLHSGPVTAGVLRGDRPRFQLFGDTIDGASRMESTSVRNMIQISYTTAAELQKYHKSHWLRRREDAVAAKGGILETYWLTIDSSKLNDTMQSVTDDSDDEFHVPDTSKTQKRDRLIEWCVELLLDYLRKVHARRQGLFLNQTASYSSLIYKKEHGKTCLDEVKETLTMQKYDPKAAKMLANVDHRKVEIDDTVVEQLRSYVSIVASAYGDNSFHNFEHCCHVSLSVEKMLNRIVSPNMEKGDHKSLHEYTHGLTSDPLVLMAIVWSGLIHDVDHRGVSNMQLAKEEPQMAQAYNNKSVAEQNSLDIAWDLLMKAEFHELRRTMFADREEMLRFRQIIVNIVLATDMIDKELNDLRKQRWQRAFETPEGAKDHALRATIVMEHIIQASDVAHTMQHWHVYRRWNQRLFLEMTAAYKAGRMGKDPADFWYQGELGFFDNYIIPLAKKLQSCGVFGVCSDECLNFALQNRREWEQKGQQVVAELQELVAGKEPTPPPSPSSQEGEF